MARGSIRQRGQSWQLRAFAGRDPLTGRDRYVARTVHGTRKEAEAALTRLLTEVDGGAHAGPDRATFADLLTEWSKLKSRSWTTSNAMETEGVIRRWVAPDEDSERWHWCPGRLRLADVTTKVLDDWQTALLTYLAPATVQRIHGIAHAALEQGVKWGWLARNPAANCEPIYSESEEVQPPDVADLRRMLDHLETNEPTLFLLVRLGAITGRRRGELCALRWTDFDAASSSLRVARTLRRAPGGWDEGPIRKNRKRFRPLALDLVTTDMLTTHRVKQVEWLATLGVAPADDDHVFLTLGRNRQSVGPWVPSGPTRKVHRIRATLGLPDEVNLKSLRHHVATVLLDAGVGLPSIAGRLGHGSGGRTTQSVYGHLMPATDHASAEILAQLLDSVHLDED